MPMPSIKLDEPGPVDCLSPGEIPPCPMASLLAETTVEMESSNGVSDSLTNGGMYGQCSAHGLSMFSTLDEVALDVKAATIPESFPPLEPESDCPPSPIACSFGSTMDNRDDTS